MRFFFPVGGHETLELSTTLKHHHYREMEPNQLMASGRPFKGNASTATYDSGVNILPNGQKFTTYGTLNFFVSGPIFKSFFSAESLDQKGHVTKYSPLKFALGGFLNMHGTLDKDLQLQAAFLSTTFSPF